jgi:drug/metabolite transporter (DMT)-like permease
MAPLTAVFSLLVGAAGWYYMFYSRAALRLQHVEGERRNRLRQRCRQANGLVMFLLAVALYAGFNSVDPQTSPQTFVNLWLGVFILLFLIILLAMVDLRLTWHLRRTRRPGPNTPPPSET